MHLEELRKEHRTLIQVRKTLNSIVKEVAPSANNPNPLSNGTIEEIKSCFAAITGREKELEIKLGAEQPVPHTPENTQRDSSLNFVKLSKRKPV